MQDKETESNTQLSSKNEEMKELANKKEEILQSFKEEPQKFKTLHQKEINSLEIDFKEQLKNLQKENQTLKNELMTVKKLHGKERERLTESKDEEIHQLNQQSLAYQKFLQFLKPPLNDQAFDDIYEYITGNTSYVGYNYEYELQLDLSKPSHMLLIKTLRYSTIPYLDEIRLEKVPADNLFVKEFMRNSIPHKMKLFEFNSPGELINANGYLEELILMNERVSESYYICNLNIHQSQFIQILSAYKNKVKHIGFKNCKLETDSVVNFGNELEGFNLEQI